MKKRVCITAFILFTWGVAFAQKDFNAYADKLFEAGAYHEVAPMYLSMLQQAYDYENNLKLAVCMEKLNRINEAEYWYGVLAKQQLGDPDILYNYAQLLKLNGKYKSAKEWFLQYAQYNEDGYYLAGTCDYAMEIASGMSAWAIDTLSINTAGSETAPAFYRSGILFASTGEPSGDKKQKINPASGLPFYDLYYAAQGSDNRLRSASLVDDIHSDLHEASAFFDTNSNTLFFTRNNYYKGRQLKGRDDAVHLQIFTSHFTEGSFSKEKPLPFSNKEFSVGHPCLSPDGSILIFASDMPGGYGGTDLYYSQRLADGWSLPVNLGATINTKGNELFPYISDAGLLYFSSNWHPGLGGYDNFVSERANGNWTRPQNLGSPLNSSRDDMAFIIRNGVGYFSSNRAGGKGSDDIYRCIHLQSIDALHIQNSHLENVIGAQVTVYAGERIDTNGYTNESGMFPIAMQDATEYTLTIEKEGYLETNLSHLEQYQSNNGIFPIYMQEIIAEPETGDLPEEEPGPAIFPVDTGGITPIEDTLIIADTSGTAIQLKVLQPIASPHPEQAHAVSQSGAQRKPVLNVTTGLPTEDSITYEVQLGVFRTPDYSKTEDFKKYGKVHSVQKDNGTTKVSVIDILTLDDAQALQKEAIAKGFAGAYIITYKNGVRIE